MRRGSWLLGAALWTCASVARAEEGPQGWSSAEAYDASLAAETARGAGLWDKCIEKDLESIEKEDRTTTRVHLAGCADRAGKVLLGLQHLQVVLEKALEAKDAEVASLAQKRVEQMMRRLASLTIEPSKEAKDLTVTIDDREVPEAQWGKPIAVDPGKHRVHAEGTLEGAAAVFDDSETVADGERATVVVALRPRAAEFLTPGQIACMQLAKTQAEVLACLPSANKPLVVRAAIEGSLYGDTFSVFVINPAVRASVTSPTHGWHVAASYLVDVISAASPDFVSTASPRGKDTRHAVAVSGGYKPERFGVEARAGYSTESDYVSRSAGAAVLGDFFDKRVTPRLGMAHSWDTISRGGTPTSVFSHALHTNEGTASVSFVLSPTSVLVTGVTAGFERGDQSKPYRLIPMFADGIEPKKGASPDEVNAARLPVRPYEQLPLERDRWAIGARLAHRFGGSTARLEQRLYADSWENRATTTDARFLVDLGSRLTVGPHARFTLQSGARFFQRVYHATIDPVVAVPIFRTTDRELGPLWAVAGGGSAWWRLTAEHAGVGLMLYASGDALYSRYTNSLYVSERWAGYGTVGVEAEFE